MVSDSQNSMLAALSGLIAPVFSPLGLGDWRISTSLIAGIMAKESVVSTLTVLFGSVDAMLSVIAPASGAALLIFCLLYTPCIAAVAAVKRELGGKWALIIALGQSVIAWIFAFAVYAVIMIIQQIV